MSKYSSFLKKLQVFGVVFGARGTKLAGIRDRDNQVQDTVTFIAPNKVQLSFPVPEFLQTAQTYFRVKNGGGANEDVLFRVAGASGDTITVDTTNVISFAGLVKLDARIATVQNNPAISKLNSQGDTIFNVDNGAATPGTPYDLGPVLADHYHDSSSSPDSQVAIVPFDFTDWFVSDGGDTYSVDLAHGLDVSYPGVTVYESTEEVWPHKSKAVDANTVRLTVSKAGADARFSGTARIEKS